MYKPRITSDKKVVHTLSRPPHLSVLRSHYFGSLACHCLLLSLFLFRSRCCLMWLATVRVVYIRTCIYTIKEGHTVKWKLTTFTLQFTRIRSHQVYSTRDVPQLLMDDSFLIDWDQTGREGTKSMCEGDIDPKRSQQLVKGVSL